MIVVDKLLKWPLEGKSKQVQRVFANGSCHMTSDTSLAELHEFAARIGMKRAWFQDGRHPHYDLNESRRAKAVKLGATETDWRGFLKACRALNVARKA
jgi:hypothetical protein